MERKLLLFFGKLTINESSNCLNRDGRRVTLFFNASFCGFFPLSVKFQFNLNGTKFLEILISVYIRAYMIEIIQFYRTKFQP